MRGAVWTGIVFTLLLHFDPQYLFFFPLIALYFLFYATRHKLLNLQFVFLFLGCVLLLLLPWTARNQRVYGDMIPIGLEAARYARPVKRLVAADVPRPDVVRNAVELWRVTRFGDEEPSRSGDRPPEPAWSLRHNLVNIATYGVLLPFFLVGVWTAVRRRHRPALVLASAVVVYFLIRVFYGGYERLRLPIEPLVILLAVYAVVDLYGRLRSRRTGAA
jgi:4-amino-4-deoxy-L-arabinose transferase-like glycosyltransferase